MSLGLPSRSFTHSSVSVAPKETNFAVIDPSGALSVVTSKGYIRWAVSDDGQFGEDLEDVPNLEREQCRQRSPSSQAVQEQ